jgi:hypothetical protein
MSKFDAASEAQGIAKHYDDASDVMTRTTKIINKYGLNYSELILLVGYIMCYLDADTNFEFLQLLEDNY